MKNILRDYQNDAHFSTGLVKQIKRTMFFQQIAKANWCDFSSKQWKNEWKNESSLSCQPIPTLCTKLSHLNS